MALKTRRALPSRRSVPDRVEDMEMAAEACAAYAQTLVDIHDRCMGFDNDEHAEAVQRLLMSALVETCSEIAAGLRSVLDDMVSPPVERKEA